MQEGLELFHAADFHLLAAYSTTLNVQLKINSWKWTHIVISLGSTSKSAHFQGSFKLQKLWKHIKESEHVSIHMPCAIMFAPDLCNCNCRRWMLERQHLNQDGMMCGHIHCTHSTVAAVLLERTLPPLMVPWYSLVFFRLLMTGHRHPGIPRNHLR